MIPSILLALLTSLWVAPSAQELKRPAILGVGRMGLYVSDMAKARAFYTDLLGYNASQEENKVVVDINGEQYIELFEGKPPQAGVQLRHFSFIARNAAVMPRYLSEHGVNVDGGTKDPDGHVVEFLEPGPPPVDALPPARISAWIMHIGFTVDRLTPAMKFYGDVLGFQDIWRGPPDTPVLSWVNMRVPDGKSYVEFMLGEAGSLGTKNHICLMVPDIVKAVAILEARREKSGYTQPIQIRTGKNGKLQANLYDPDGTRVELMEPNPFNGKAVPSSTAPPPSTSSASAPAIGNTAPLPCDSCRRSLHARADVARRSRRVCG